MCPISNSTASLPGTPTHCYYELMTFGIPIKDFPLTDTGRVKTKSLIPWIKTRVAIDAAFLENRPFEGVECPLRQDVLFFNAGHKWSHPGNTAFREILASKHSKYLQSTTNAEKRAIIHEIISEVTTTGGRFLAWPPASKGWWDVLAPDSKSLKDKVGSALRDDYKRMKEKGAHVQTSTSSTFRFTGQDCRKRNHDGTLVGCTGGCSP
jgi:hypothetical protein